MNIYVYQERAYETAVYPESVRVLYPLALLSEETGELVGKFAKLLRVDEGWRETVWNDQSVRGAIVKEMGDVLWALAALAEDLGMSLDTIAEENLRKLADRKARGVISGEGDNR